MRVQKIIAKMERQPNGIRFSEISKVLDVYGYNLVRKEGSHRQFRNDRGDVITIKEEDPLKASMLKMYLEE